MPKNGFTFYYHIIPIKSSSLAFHDLITDQARSFQSSTHDLSLNSKGIWQGVLSGHTTVKNLFCTDLPKHLENIWVGFYVDRKGWGFVDGMFCFKPNSCFALMIYYNWPSTFGNGYTLKNQKREEKGRGLLVPWHIVFLVPPDSTLYYCLLSMTQNFTESRVFIQSMTSDQLPAYLLLPYKLIVKFSCKQTDPACKKRSISFWKKPPLFRSSTGAKLLVRSQFL